MRILITPYISDLMVEGKPFALDYDNCEIHVDGLEFLQGRQRWIYGAVKNNLYCLYIPKSLAVWIPMDVVSKGYSAIRDYIKGTIGVEIGA